MEGEKADANGKMEKDKEKKNIKGFSTFSPGTISILFVSSWQGTATFPQGSNIFYPQPFSEMLSLNCQQRWKEFLLKLLTEQSCCQMKIRLLDTAGLWFLEVGIRQR